MFKGLTSSLQSCKKVFFEVGGIFLRRHETVLLSAFGDMILLSFGRGAMCIKIYDVKKPEKSEQEHGQSMSRRGWEG